MEGSNGNDNYVVDNTGDVVQEFPNQGFDTVRSQITTFRLPDNVEGLILLPNARNGLGNDQSNHISVSTENTTGNALRGFGGKDLLSGGVGNDLLDGGDGDDELADQLGNDTLVGGNGNDKITLSFKQGFTFSDNVNLNLTNTSLSGTRGSQSIKTTLQSIEAGELNLGNALNAVKLDGSAFTAGNVTLRGGAGADSLLGGSGSDKLSGSAGADTLEGGAGKDTLDGSDGNDRLLGGDGDDILTGSFGTNVLDGGAGFDQVFEQVNQSITLTNTRLTHSSQAGFTLDDTLVNIESVRLEAFPGKFDSQQNATLDASLFTLGSVVFTGDKGNNTLLGGTKNDFLEGGAGDDHMEGGLGDDKYIVDSINDQAIETSPQGGTADTIVSSVSFTLGDNLEVLELTRSADLNGTGNSQNNILSGNTGNNILKGGAGNDALIGDAGNDVLEGGSGNDILTSGTGSDRFVYSTGVAFKRTDLGNDTIRDFNSGDAIVLNPLTFNTLKSSVGIGLSDASDFAIVTKDGDAATSSARLIYDSSNGHLFYNPNGTATGFGSGGQFATLENKPTLSASDFILSISTVLPQSSSAKPILNGIA